MLSVQQGSGTSDIEIAPKQQRLGCCYGQQILPGTGVVEVDLVVAAVFEDLAVLAKAVHQFFTNQILQTVESGDGPDEAG
ncbi:MAG TPA: hypothetical protein DHW45_02115 [Candidatus Latescibacteria bacterium]|nr:hypothetical protein [Candidatus Latescibacterota bacterium]